MMTQPQYNEHTYLHVYAAFSFSCQEHEPVGQCCLETEKPGLNIQVEKAPAKHNSPENKASSAIRKMPLWPSLAALQPEIESVYPWKDQIKQVLQCRSVFIATLLTMAGVGLALVL